MSGLDRKTDIKKTESRDKKEVDKETKKSDVVVDDGSKVDQADKKISLKGTEEGAKDVRKSVANAMKDTKKVHADMDKKLQQKFGEIKNVEKELDGRSKDMKNDEKSLQKEQNSMKSADTKAAQNLMKEASDNARKDAGFLKESSDNEKKTREAGQAEMKKQTSKMKSFSVKG